MTRYGTRVQLFAASLSFLAGFVDAVGFLAIGGFFVSFMSGNSTRMSVGLAEGTRGALIGGSLIALFLLGVIAGSLLGHWTDASRRSAVLALVAALLAVGAICGAFGFDRATIGAMALAMGAENAVFERDGDVHIGLTYMTGTLVRLGGRIAMALTGRDRLGWLPFLMLWLGLVAGAVYGALMFRLLALAALWIAVAIALAAALVARHIET